MSPFEFFFSFYGLVLGLAMTEACSGVSRAINQRRRRPIGWRLWLLQAAI